ncbi:MAG: hypothetical protein BGO88_04100 [Flavobacterium sp. 38-13]|uniref:sensor histidine kinase n=1 Tax=Flavobacterium sp. 38-13 TaxID=1896168 RepID=UPI00095FDE66|nr:histidine kinase [Flavobacterium sp. 38-13]OJX52463.1 MAG: hypothetical protein BGO88_04100 [Flavobacterium sp. 38-13]
MGHQEKTNLTKRNSIKNVLLVTFTFFVSYATVFIIFPYSYWHNFFAMPVYKQVEDVLVNLIFCVAIVWFSLFIDRKLNKKIPWMVRPLKRLLIQAIFQILGALFLIICLTFAYLIFGGTTNPQPSPIGLREGVYTIISIMLWALMVSALNTGDFLLRNWKEATIKAAEHEINAVRNKQLASEIELQALKMQLDPHFVFNNLSVLSELILKDQQLGYEYTENFTKVYRYLLVNSKKKLIPLAEELKFLDAYLFLIRHRMGEGCVFMIDIEASKFKMMIPPVTLQLFIENALKYNRTEEENPLHVAIYSNDNDELVVTNNLLPLVNNVDSTGIGLKNIIDRYALLSDRKPSVIEDGKTFTVKVPLIS